MSDDPNRARCKRCKGFMSKDREPEGICFLCSIAPGGIWRPVPIAKHRYAVTGQAERVRGLEEEGNERR